jgi:hypothetical protein
MGKDGLQTAPLPLEEKAFVLHNRNQVECQRPGASPCLHGSSSLSHADDRDVLLSP